MSEVELLQYVEIDLNPCSLTYGVSPCSAEVGVTGTRKCFNSPATCQDIANFTAGDTVTHRFAKPTESLPVIVDAIPNIAAISLRPQEAKPGIRLGTHESANISFFNHQHNDAGYDNYLSERTYNTYNLGTHWGKFAARWPNIQGHSLRTLFGEVGQDLTDFEIRHYYIEETAGPGADGIFTIVAKDALKFIDGKKAQMPKPSNGSLNAAITDTDTTLTLQPTGIGDLEYPSSGTASIGGEMVTFTRSGDGITLTGRGLYSSTQESHEEDETFQLAVVYSSQSPADILDDIIFGTHSDGTNRSDMPSTYQNLSDWQTELTNFYGRALSAIIARPTPLSTLISEIIEHVGLLFYTDNIDQKIRLQVLRQGVIVLAVSDEVVKPGSYDIKQMEEARISDIWTSYGQKNPLLNLDEDGNFKAIAADYDTDDVKTIENLPAAIKRVYSRWITVDNRVAANDFNERMIERFAETPGIAKFSLAYGYPVKIGSNITLQSRIFEDDIGNQADPRTAIVTSLERTEGWYQCTAATINHRLQSGATPGSSSHTILIDESAINVNLRTLHDLIYTDVGSGNTIDVIILAGVTIGSQPSSTYEGSSSSGKFTAPDPAFDVGDWPGGTAINITNYGTIQGGPGRGALIKLEWNGVGAIGSGWVWTSALRASDGGTAFYTRVPVTIDNQGSIWSGGGGGGASEPPTQPAGRVWEAWGGDGAGYTLITGKPTWADSGKLASQSAGGKGGYNSYNDSYGTYSGAIGSSADSGQDGGDPGQNGISGDDNGVVTAANLISYPRLDVPPAANAGAAVDGDSYVTYTTVGDIQGPTIN